MIWGNFWDEKLIEVEGVDLDEDGLKGAHGAPL